MTDFAVDILAMWRTLEIRSMIKAVRSDYYRDASAE